MQVHSTVILASAANYKERRRCVHVLNRVREVVCDKMWCTKNLCGKIGSKVLYTLIQKDFSGGATSNYGGANSNPPFSLQFINFTVGPAPLNMANRNQLLS